MAGQRNITCTRLIEAWTKEVEEATEGRIKITIYPGGALAKGPELYDTVAAGAVDMAWVASGLWFTEDCASYSGPFSFRLYSNPARPF